MVCVVTSKLPETFRSWGKYSEYVESLVHLTHEGIANIQRTPELLRTHGVDSGDFFKEAERKAKYAGVLMDNDFTLVHAHALLGLWGALESHIEDVFVARLTETPSLLADLKFKKVKIPASAAGQEARVLGEAVLLEVSRLSGADLSSAPGRFERVLAYVGLNGAVPSEISHALHHAQAIRNVYAHRGGVADSRFVESCPDLGIGAGEPVELPFHRFSPLMHGMHMYDVLITSRYRKCIGEPIIWAECVGFKGVLKGMLETDEWRGVSQEMDEPS